MSPFKPIALRSDRFVGRRCLKRRALNEGLTLIELMIALTLAGGFIAVVYETVLVGLRAAHSADDRSNASQQVVNALERLIRESSVASNVDQAQDQRFQFDADIDGNGTTESNINYVVQGGDLVRIQGGVTVTLIRDLSTLDFNYVDLANAAMTTPVSAANRPNVRVVQITVTAVRGTETISLATAVFLRNNS